MRSRRIGLLALICLLLVAPAAYALQSAGADQMARKAAPKFGIANANLPLPGVMTAGQPTGEQLQLLAEDGYHTVIDLRPADEPRGFDETAAAKDTGLTYINIPVTPATLDQATIDRFLDAFKKAQRPVLVHCSSANRVGALFYSWLALEQKVPAEKALEQAKAIGLHSPELTEKVQKLVAERQPPATR